jgi:hypothetical protein
MGKPIEGFKMKKMLVVELDDIELSRLGMIAGINNTDISNQARDFISQKLSELADDVFEHLLADDRRLS